MDPARHSAAQHDEVRHTLTVRDVEGLLAKAGVQRSHRHVLRLCQSGMFDAVKVPGGPSGDEWYVAPQSVPKAIGDLKQIDARRARRGVTEHDMAHDVTPKIPEEMDQDTPSHSAPQPDASGLRNQGERKASRPDAARHGTTDLEIYEHPYVKRLESQVEKLEGKLEAQVRRTEEIQLKTQEKLVELQRMTTIGQSKTLAEFMLQAKNWIVGAEPESGPTSREEGESPS